MTLEQASESFFTWTSYFFIENSRTSQGEKRGFSEVLQNDFWSGFFSHICLYGKRFRTNDEGDTEFGYQLRRTKNSVAGNNNLCCELQ